MSRTLGTDRDHSAKRKNALFSGHTSAGWLFTAPSIAIIAIFLVIPIVLAVWVSLSDWNGLGSPLSGKTEFVGLDNYATILAEPGLARDDFGISLRNNFYYVLFVVPLQTALSLFLAVQVNRRILRGRGFFRTAFYFPSITSSVAIVIVFLFLFSASGAVNTVLGWFGAKGPNWFSDPSGIFHNMLAAFGITSPPPFLADEWFLGVTGWQWISGPSIAMCALIIMAVWTTSGTFMLLFLAALQAIGSDVREAALIDGAGPIRTFFSITLPLVKPTIFTVLTLGLIGTWQLFDAIYLTGGGAPGKTTLTPAYLAYETSFKGLDWGQGAAISFILFGIIVTLTLLQRFILKDRDRTTLRTRRGVTAGNDAAPRGREGSA